MTTTDSVQSQSLLTLSWPIFLERLTGSVVILVDLWFLSQMSDQIAGIIGMLTPVLWLGTFVIPVFAGTGTSVASQYLGAGQRDKAQAAYFVNLMFSTGLGLLATLGFFLFSGHIGLWLGMTPAMNITAQAFLQVMAFFFIFLATSSAYRAILSALGWTRWMMWTSLIANLINAATNALFFYGYHMGPQGVAASSVIAMAVSLILSMWVVHQRAKISFHWRGAKGALKAVLGPMLKIGIPNALEPFSFTMQQIFLSAIVVALGETAMAGYSYVWRSLMIEITACWALSAGGQILMAHLMGQRDFKGVHRVFWQATGIGMAVALLNAVLFALFADQIINIFTHDPAIHALAKPMFLICLMMEPARAVNIIAGTVLKAVGDARFPAVTSMIFMWGILPVVYGIQHYWGLTMVVLWACFAADEIMRAFVNIWRWQTRRWEKMGIANPHHEAPSDTLPDEPTPA